MILELADIMCCTDWTICFLIEVSRYDDGSAIRAALDNG